MKYSDLLPAGSVVLLKEARKRVVVIGLMPIKHIKSREDIAYDYIGVPYPEGYIGTESAFLFNHGDIQHISFIGYSDGERELFVDTIQIMIDKVKDIVKTNSCI